MRSGVQGDRKTELIMASFRAWRRAGMREWERSRRLSTSRRNVPQGSVPPAVWCSQRRRYKREESVCSLPIKREKERKAERAWERLYRVICSECIRAFTVFEEFLKYTYTSLYTFVCIDMHVRVCICWVHETGHFWRFVVGYVYIRVLSFTHFCAKVWLWTNYSVFITSWVFCWEVQKSCDMRIQVTRCAFCAFVNFFNGLICSMHKVKGLKFTIYSCLIRNYIRTLLNCN